MGIIYSKTSNQPLSQDLPQSPSLTLAETVESGVSVCHHMVSLLTTGSREVRQTALQVLQQLTCTSASNLLLDQDCAVLVAEAVLRVLKGGSSIVPFDTVLISLEIIGNVFPYLGEDVAQEVCKDRCLDDLLSKVGQLGLVGGKVSYNIRSKKHDLETPGGGLQLPQERFGSTDIRYRGNGIIFDRSSSQLDNESINWNVPIKKIRSDEFFPTHTCSDVRCNQSCQANDGMMTKGDSIRMMMKKMDDDESADPVAVESAAGAGAVTQEFLRRGDNFPKAQSSRVELWMPEDGDGGFFSKAHLAKLICGMLNSPFGGTIYMGIHQDGTIQGLDVNRDCRDLIRRNLAKVVYDNISPTVLSPDQISIDFIPVDCEDGKRLSVVVVRIAAFPTCGIVWEAPRIYRCRHLSMDLLEMEGRYLRMEGEGPIFNLKMEAMEIHKQQRKLISN